MQGPGLSPSNTDGVRTNAAVAVVAAIMLLVAAPAGAGEQVARTLAYTFVPPTISVGAGETLSLQNLDRDVHTLTSTDTGPDGEPLFDSGLVTLLGSQPVAGVNELEPGSYEFFCRVHEQIPTMYGTLDVR